MAKAWFKTEDEDELDDLIAEFGGIEKITQILREQAIKDAVANIKSDAKQLPSKE